MRGGKTVGWVEFEKVTKKFGDVMAVNNVSFSIERGEFFTLLGPSGCGKTTTLRLIAGLEIPTSGIIRIAGEDVTIKFPGQRNVAMVFQNYALYPHMTVYQNIAYPLVVRKTPKKKIEERVKYVAEHLQIDTLLDRYPMEISGGQQQRVALARAIIQTPNVFLLDEPLSNLDAKLRLEARSFLKHLHHELETTTIYVTHDQSEAMALSTRIAVMNEGIVKQIGTPKEIYEKPADIFVAGFIGNPPMNILEFHTDGNSMILDGQKIEIEKIHGILKKLGEKAYLGIRPEYIKLGKEGDLVGEVYVVEPLGVENVVTLKLEKQYLKVLTFEETVFKPGQKLWIHFRRDKLNFFDSSGKRVTFENEEET